MSTYYMRVFRDNPTGPFDERFVKIWEGCNGVPRQGDLITLGKGDDQQSYTVTKVIWPLDGDVFHAGHDYIHVIVRPGG